jgi:hypothetical protein
VEILVYVYYQRINITFFFFFEGKSAVGILTAAACAAKGLFIVYIPSAISWVSDAESGHGDSFFLDCFVKQNADLILGSELLRPVFMTYFLGEDPLDSATMIHLSEIMAKNPKVAVGVIVDEVQAITEEVEERKYASYFKNRWFNWQGKPGRLFVRMDIASSHGKYAK